MATVKPFRGLRPPKEIVERVASRPYDVLDSAEARAEAAGNPMSLYHIIKPEIDFEPGTDEYDPRVYAKAAENFALFQERGWLVPDVSEHYYIYAQTMNGKTQHGIVVCASVSDYLRGVIKRHELTRRDKEEDRMRHVRVTDANMEPVFLAYPDDATLHAVVSRYAGGAPEYDFTAPGDGFRHRFWTVDSKDDIRAITSAFAKIPSLYIADGHHRTAAAALVGAEKAAADAHHMGDEEYNYFMAVCFPASELTILDYNRVVRDLAGLTAEQFVNALNRSFTVEAAGARPYRPSRLHECSVYVRGQWYKLTAREGTYDPDDPIGSLDVDITSRLILRDILHITDLRTDSRIDFVGGLRGLEELSRRVDSGEMSVALALYPVSMSQIMAIADSGKIMPPKATWFEPKLRSGLVVHKLS